MSTCARCGSTFECGMADTSDDAPCWCTQLPTLPVHAYQTNKDDNTASGCFCPACLRVLVAANSAPQNGKT